MIDGMSAQENLSRLGLRTEIAKCRLYEAPSGGYDIQSQGPLGGRHGTLFRADGDEAEIVSVAKKGWIGHRPLNVPIESHVEVLRKLGFTAMTFPDGKKYEIRPGVPGVRRIR